MDGKTLKSGAVACIQNVKNPIEVAYNVLEKTDHCLIVGKGALLFAKSVGIKEIDQNDLLIDREVEFLKKIKNDEKFKSKTSFVPKNNKMGYI
jgi:L-asparaginase / beta-aspartyl-peptidase